MKFSKKKSFREVACKPCGESSPYWNWLLANRKTDDGSLIEPIEANPDRLSEEAHLFASHLTESNYAQLDAITHAWPKLSARERQVYEWCGHEGKTVAQTAALMRISRESVNIYLSRIRQKIHREYEKLIK